MAFEAFWERMSCFQSSLSFAFVFHGMRDGKPANGLLPTRVGTAASSGIPPFREIIREVDKLKHVLSKRQR
jgi:hypothetical protein